MGKKRKRTSTATKDKKKTTATTTKKGRKRRKLSNSDDEEDYQQHRGESKNEFERKKKEVLKNIPLDVKNLFQEVGFAKWQKNFLPVLVLSPYSVPPGAVREQWLKMYEKVKENYRLDSMSLLVSWYGTYDSNSAYSLVPRKNFITYEDGCKLGYDTLPKKIQSKQDSGKKLSGSEEFISLGIAQIKKEFEKNPEDRKHLLTDFLIDDDDED